MVWYSRVYTIPYIGGKVISNLHRYADDIVLLATSPEELQELVSRVERAAEEYNMLITICNKDESHDEHC